MHEQQLRGTSQFGLLKLRRQCLQNYFSFCLFVGSVTLVWLQAVFLQTLILKSNCF